MFKVNLEEKLLNEKAKRARSEEAVIEEANAIINDSAEEDQDILRDAGFSESLKKYKRLIPDDTDKVLDPKRIFIKEEIKSLCVKYGLRFLSTNRYKGRLDTEIASKIKEFRKTYFNDKESDKPFFDSIKDELFIAAPKSSFKLEKKVADPLLFNYIGNDRYYLIHKWGNDLSWWRYFWSFPARSYGHWMGTFIPMLAVFLAVTILLSVFNIHFLLLIIPWFFITLVLILVGRSAKDNRNFSENEWDSSFE